MLSSQPRKRNQLACGCSLSVATGDGVTRNGGRLGESFLLEGEVDAEGLV